MRSSCFWAGCRPSKRGSAKAGAGSGNQADGIGEGWRVDEELERGGDRAVDAAFGAAQPAIGLVEPRLDGPVGVGNAPRIE